METFRNNPFNGELDVVATLSERAIHASLRELLRQDELTLALRGALRLGADIDSLSAASGLTPAEIRRRVDSELHIKRDIDFLAGLL